MLVHFWPSQLGLHPFSLPMRTFSIGNMLQTVCSMVKQCQARNRILLTCGEHELGHIYKSRSRLAVSRKYGMPQNACLKPITLPAFTVIWGPSLMLAHASVTLWTLLDFEQLELDFGALNQP